MVCRSCGIDYSPPKPVEESTKSESGAEDSTTTKSDDADKPNSTDSTDKNRSEDPEAPRELRPFHLAFPVDDLPAARKFYTEVLGCTTGREKEESCVFNFYGHQIVAHRVPKMPELSTSPVDGKKVPAMHFGLVLEWDDWQELKTKFEAEGHRICDWPLHQIRRPARLTSDYVHQSATPKHAPSVTTQKAAITAATPTETKASHHQESMR